MTIGAADRSSRGLRHVAIRASAGTGKTYQLTNRFLRLLAEGESPERILAVTFTRKAAGEIFERIAGRLADGAAGEEAAARLAEDVGVEGIGAEQWAAMLTRLLRSAHRLNIGTLDSVFVRIAQAFSLELGLPPRWSIGSALQEQQLRERALAASLEAHDPQTLIEAVRLLNRDESRASVAGAIERTVDTLHAIYLDAPEAAAWRWLEAEAASTGLLDEAALAGAVGALWEAPVEEDKRMAKAKRADAERAIARDWPEFLKTGLAGALRGDRRYHGKEVPDWLAALYDPLIAHATAALLKALADANQAAHTLVAGFDEQYDAMQRAQRLQRFEDLTRRLAVAQLTERWETLLYRLDARFDHLLLDEFQDTARQQWRVIRPLAREITAQDPAERSFFCVGDAKQSIYGWRGGEPAIFRGLDAELPSGIDVDTLALNRRSGPDVIETVNAVFQDVSANPAVRHFAEAAAEWAAGFEPHKPHRASLRGYCELSVADVPSGKEGRPKLFRHVAERVATLIEQPGVGTVAVLTRTNPTVARMISELRLAGVAASQEGGNPLTDSPAVSVVLSLLQLADHPTDSAAAFHVSRSPLGPIVDLDPDASPQRVRELAASIRGRLVHEGYGPCVEAWARAMAGDCGPRNARRLEQLAGLAWDYDASATLRPSDFVQHVQREQVEEPTAAAVRVMTVHKAKGLQFDAVVLPELDKPMVDPKPPVLVDRPDPIGGIERVSQPGDKPTRALSPTLERMYAQYQQREANDALSMLYVALTRAVRAVYMVLPPCAERTKQMPPTFGGLVWAALVGEEPPKAAGVGWAIGDEQWPTSVGVDADASAPEAATARGEGAGLPERIALASSRRRNRMLPRQTPSRLEAGGRVDVTGLLRPGRRKAVERGSLIHAWCEQIGWLDEGAPDAETLRQIAKHTAMTSTELDALIAAFRKMIEAEPVHRALCRARYEADRSSEPSGADLSIDREVGFAVRDGEHLLEGVFDRLVVERQDGRPARAEVLDFKTDADPPGAIIERYRPQLQAYRRAAATMLGLDVDAVDATLIMLAHGEVSSL